MIYNDTPYFSPLSLLELNELPSLERKSVLLAKKKLLAELELNGGTTVLIKDKELSKNDIIRFFDDLQLDNNLSYHQAVAQDPALIFFLEKAAVLPAQLFNDNLLYKDAEFIEWISPFFALSFARVARAYFSSLDALGWDDLLLLPRLINRSYMEKAWMKIEETIQENIGRLKEMHEQDTYKQKGGKGLGDLELLCDFRALNMIIGLPADRFGAQADEYAFEMMLVLIDVFNHQDRKYASDTLQNAKILASSDYMKNQIQEKSNEFDRIMLASRSRNVSSYNSTTSMWSRSEWGPARLIVFLIIIIARLITCNEFDNNNNNSNTFFSQNSPSPSPSYTSPVLSQTTEPGNDPVYTAPATSEHERVYDAPPNPNRRSPFISVASKSLHKFTEAVYAKNPSSSNPDAVEIPASGSDPYSKYWSKIAPASNTNVAGSRFNINNNSHLQLIVFVNSGDRIFSVYVKPNESAQIKLTGHENLMIPYLGEGFSRSQSFQYQDALGKNKILVNGVFTKNIGRHKKWLKDYYKQDININMPYAGRLDVLEEDNGIIDIYLFND